MVTNIENKACDTWTPLAESFYEGVRYYRQDSPHYHNGNYSVNQNLDPFYYQDKGQYVECGNNFILLITDGESTMDKNIPAEYQDYDDDNNDPGSYGSNGSDYLDDVALWAHTNDMRTGAKNLEGEQVITLYTVFAFGSGSQLLMDAAKNGGFIDRNGNDIPDNDLEWDEDDDGVPDNYLEAPNGNELEAKIITAITAILQRSASGTAVSILSASSEGEGSLYQAFFKPVVFDDMREINWLGYLNSLWVDPYGNLREDTVHDNALVYGDDKIIKFTIDEESGDTAIERYHDNTGPEGVGEPDGLRDSDTPYETVLLSDLDPQWEAGEKLALRNVSERSIKTWVDIDGDGEVDTADEYIDFHEANASKLRPFLDVATDDEAISIINFIRGEPGSTSYRDRNVTIGANECVWKLGDIVHSTPTVVGRPMEMYNQYYSDVTYGQFFSQWKNRGVTIYVGANDGMLHAFKAGTFTEGDNPATANKEEHGWYSATEDPATTEGLGDERWAYIPYNLLPHLKWLTIPDYTHVYYVDLKPKVTDVRIFSDDVNHPHGWGTILIGGMRLGGGEYTFTEDFDGDGLIEADEGIIGDSNTNPWTFRSAYFVLDITVPNSPVLLGEGSDLDLGFTTSYPAVARVETNVGFNNPEDDEWFFIVGSGPTECDGNSDQDGYIFVIDLDGEQIMKKFGPLDSNAFMANPITLDINLNYNVESSYIGETNDPGSDNNPANDLGKMHRITTRDTTKSALTYHTNPANWVRTTLFDVPNTPPITASATASLDEESTNFGAIDNGSDVIHGNILIYFGTGRYYNDEDKGDTSTQQYFYGIKDSCPYGDCAAADTVISLNELYYSTNIIILTNGEVISAAATEWGPFVSEVQAKKGWYIDLAAGGERQLNRPSILGGVVLFAPFTPEADVCGFGGSGKLYALYYETGTAYYEDIMGTVDYPGDKKKCLTKISLDKGITSEIGLHVGKKAECTGFIQQGTGSVTQVEVDPAFNIKSGIVGWVQH
jgi:type IV pilus assembly protein PilY1